MSRFIIYIIFMFLCTNTFATEVELLHAHEWLVPKQATTILDMPAIYNSMQKLQKDASSSLVIKYPGGDEGTLWVNEVRSWLVALGLSSKRIELVQGGAISTTIEFEVLSASLNPNTISYTEK
jgi:hypothetical protein